MADNKIDRMRERAREIRRAANLSHNAEIVQILLSAADQAEADAADMEAQLNRPIQELPPQT